MGPGETPAVAASKTASGVVADKAFVRRTATAIAKKLLLILSGRNEDTDYYCTQ